MTIVERLQEHMKRKNLKLTQVAEITGIPYSRMHKWISGVNKPKAEDAEVIDDWINGRTSNLLMESEVKYRTSNPEKEPCMATLAKAMDVILSQQQTIAIQLSLLQQFAPGAQPKVA